MTPNKLVRYSVGFVTETDSIESLKQIQQQFEFLNNVVIYSDH